MADYSAYILERIFDVYSICDVVCCFTLGYKNHESGQEEDAGQRWSPRPSQAKRKPCLYKSYARCSNSFSRIKKVLISTLIDLWTNNNVWSVLMFWIVFHIGLLATVFVCVCARANLLIIGYFCNNWLRK